MDTTTPVAGADDSAQPTQPTEAVTTEGNEQAIVQDENGTPSLEPVTSTNDQPSAPAVEDAAPKDATAPETQATDDTIEWAKKKGLEINPDNPNEVKLAQMQREAEKKMHQATQRTVTPPEEIPLTGTESIDAVVSRQNETEMKLYVRDWFDANPDMKDAREELTKIAEERPWLQNLDDVKAHYLAQPGRTEQLKFEGGREALTNLAQKQQAVPPSAGATNSASYETNQITPQNVYDLVDKNDQAWFEKNHDAISKAISGN